MQRLVSSSVAAASVCCATNATNVTQRREISKGQFVGPDKMVRSRMTTHTEPLWGSNKFGGRLARLRELGFRARRVRTTEFSKDPKIIQFNMDVWNAQNTLRKKWKARDWEVVEMPYELAPKVLQKVIPDMYTAPPMPADPAAGDYSNIRAKVFDREELQEALFTDVAARKARGEEVDASQMVLPYPPIRKVDRSAKYTLDKFL